MNDLYKVFKRTPEYSRDKYVTEYRLEYKGTKYIVYMTKKRGNKLTEIECVNNELIWKQYNYFPFLLSPPIPETNNVFIAKNLNDSAVQIVVINGKPGTISGLDSGIFRSALNTGGCGYLNVMTLSAFKNLTV